jgi:hypothetical protein
LPTDSTPSPIFATPSFSFACSCSNTLGPAAATLLLLLLLEPLLLSASSSAVMFAVAAAVPVSRPRAAKPVDSRYSGCRKSQTKSKSKEKSTLVSFERRQEWAVQRGCKDTTAHILQTLHFMTARWHSACTACSVCTAC